MEAGGFEPKTYRYRTPQLDNNSATEPNRQPSNGLLVKQHNTLPIQNNNSSKHQIGANMVHFFEDCDLKQLITAWPELPEHIKAAIRACCTMFSNPTVLGPMAV